MTKEKKRNKNPDDSGIGPDQKSPLAIPNVSGTGLTEAMHTGQGLASPFMKEIYLTRQAIVGTRYVGGSDELVEDLEPGSRITLIREPDNRFDPKAVMALDEQGRKLGYIPRQDNTLISALMDAGKYFYGIITKKPEGTNHTGGRTPYSIYMDLYMREFAMPGDLSQIPRQGYRSSYAVVYMNTELEPEKAEKQSYTDDEDICPSICPLSITGIYAIKVINGEERGCFRRHLDKEHTPEEYREMIRAFWEFAGYLPLVSHNFSGNGLETLEEDYGVLLGIPFSNRIIDTYQMARNHIGYLDNYGLEDLTAFLGIEAAGTSEEEIACRGIWQLYCRMERSELDRRNVGKETGGKKNETDR